MHQDPQVSSILRCDVHRLNLHSSLYKSKYLLYSGAQLSPHHDQRDLLSVNGIGANNPGSIFSSYFLASSFHTDRILHKDESKVEKVVKALKEEAETGKDEKESVVKHVAEAVPAVEEPAPPAPVKKSLWERFVAELKHYYHGFRLLFIDIRICSRLLWNVLNGKSLTRRERRQMVRTTADLFRLLPFLVFLLVPFMELLLPVAIKLFPNMLPSTFFEENKEQEKLKKNLKVKLEMAKFLQETIHETALQSKKKKGAAVEEFSQFVDKIRKEGTRPTTKEIMKFAKLFEDEITLDNMSRQQLRAVCRVLGIQPIGIDALLRFQLDVKLRQLKADDKMILKEGIDSLSYQELQGANRARGMRALGVSEDRLREQLRQWLTLHVEKNIPTSLLLLSRTLYLPDTLSAEQQIEATLSELTTTSPSTAEEAKLKAAELAGEDVDNKIRLEIIKKEEDIIAAEADDRKHEAEAAEEEIARVVQQEREAAEAVAAKVAMDRREELQDEALNLLPPKAEELVDKAPEPVGLPGEEEKITTQDLEDIETALEEIAGQKKLSIEKEELQDLKEEVNEYKEDLMDLKEVIVRGGSNHVEMVESKAAKRLIKRVDKLIHQADSVVHELQAEKERYQEEIEVGEVRLRRSAELKSDESRVEEVMKQISARRDNIVSINEMLLAMKRLQKVPNETKLQRIVEVLDEDKDGKININLALKVLEVLGRENVKLEKAQVTEMLSLLKREHELAEEEKKEKKVREEKEKAAKQREEREKEIKDKEKQEAEETKL